MTQCALPPQTILAHYAPALDGLRWVRVNNGFSSAVVWRGDDADGIPLFALKAWQPGLSADRVSQIHQWQSQAAPLPFVPTLLPTMACHTFVNESNRLWDVTRWMAGSPRSQPTRGELGAACEAVAQLHNEWHVESHGPCPGVVNRLRILSDFRSQFRSVSKLPIPFASGLEALLQRAVEAVSRYEPRATESLRRWELVRFALQPCVRDLRGEHVLFTDEQVTGIVDFGAASVDHVAVDLARLLGDWGCDDDEFRKALLQYRESGGQLDVPDDFVVLLARTGDVCSLIGWLVRVLSEQRSDFDPVSVAQRLENLLSRVESWR